MAERVLTSVVTTDPVLRAGIVAELRLSPDVLVTEGDAWHGGQVLQPHVAIVAGDTVNEEVLKLVRSNARNGHRRVVIVATHLDSNAVFAALEAGACGFLQRDQATSEQLVRVVVAAANGEGSLPPDMLGTILDNLARLQRQVLGPRGLSLAPLTDREVAVLRLLSEGYAVAEISQELSYSERTIKSIIHDVTLRLGLRNRTHAVAYALREGLI